MWTLLMTKDFKDFGQLFLLHQVHRHNARPRDGLICDDCMVKVRIFHHDFITILNQDALARSPLTLKHY